MEPTYIPIYKVNTRLLSILFAIAVILGIFGLAGILDHFFFNHSLKFTDNPFFSVFLVFQSAISVFMVYNGFRNSKYFVAWNKNEFNYYLPNNQQMETIPTNKIESVEFEKQFIKIKLKNSDIKCFNTNYLYHPKRELVKNYFQSLKK